MIPLCVIPARGGSKRVPLKNLQPICGKPLVVWTIEAAQRAGLSPIVSTEDAAIGCIAEDCGATWLHRPLELCADDTSTEAVLIHALNTCSAVPWKWVMCLPPTSPCRGSNVILSVMDRLDESEEVDTYMTVTEYRGDLWERRGNVLHRMREGAPRRQQERDPVWEENSAVYLTRSTSLWMTRSVIGYGNVVGVPITREDGWDINDHLDLKVADMIIRERLLRRPDASL